MGATGSDIVNIPKIGKNRTFLRGLLLMISGALIAGLADYLYANRTKLKSFALNLEKDLPDIRDFSITDLFDFDDSTPIVATVDLRPKCPPVYDQGTLGSCFSSDTETLTEKGWKLFKDAKAFGLKLATVNPVTREWMFEYPSSYTIYNYKGKLICTDTEQLNFAVTPNHRMLVRKCKEKSKFEFVEADELDLFVKLMSASYDGSLKVSQCEKEDILLNRESLQYQDYNDKVYCAEMPTYHTLVTRHNGKILIAGNCTANAGVAALVMISNLKVTLSRLYQYFQERKIEGTIAKDAGASLRDVGKAMQTVGVCEETYMPYNVANFANTPSAQADTNAAKYKVANYYSVTTLQQIKQTINQTQQPVLMLIEVYDNFETTGNNGIVALPSGNFLGNHCVLCVGYSEAQQYLIMRNSWGTGWGDKGYFYLPYSFVDQGFASDFWYLKAN